MIETALTCPTCKAPYDEFWTEGLTERGFLYCHHCHSILHIEHLEKRIDEYIVPLSGLWKN
ncbi:MAG: hypothetical protein RDV48_07330 [Candidatus Eremiobacteraeota bacterium]|nr:hypothetical protein [Candidatus Eremiobacteraeota bacterium]